MQQIALGDYLKRIEGLLEENRLAEAAAHCHYILQQQPQHVATYRLFGRALLEQQLYDDAVDIFQRVLSADPEDLIAHAGIAVIYRQKDRLGQAIWHMERAFEADPYNRALRAELNELYARHDGEAPLRLELNRAALAHLYVRGGLTQQATIILRQLLGEQPDRVDLQILLAETLWREQRLQEAASLCQEVLDQLPNCLKAHAMLVTIWQELGHLDEAQLHWRRLHALALYDADEPDPSTMVGQAYRAVAGSQPLDEVMVAELDYLPAEQAGSVDDWLHSAGSAIGGARIPDWLRVVDDSTADRRVDRQTEPEKDDVEPDERNISAAKPPPPSEEADVTGSAERAGTEPAQSISEYDSDLYDSEEKTGGAAEPGPEWLNAMLGLEQTELESLSGWMDSAEGAEERDTDLPGWLLNEVGLSSGDLQEDEVAETEVATPPTGEPEPTRSLVEPVEFDRGFGDSQEELTMTEPDSPRDENELPEAEADESEMDWLEELAAEPSADWDDSASALGEPTDGAGAEDLPDWLGTDDVDLSESALPDWLEEVAAPETAPASDQEDTVEDEPAVAEESSAEEEELSWLDQIAGGQGEPIEEPPTISWDELDEAESETAFEEEMAWLHEVPAEEDEMPVDEPAAELADADGAEDTEGASAEMLADEVPDDPDEAMAWLERLAARQGARLEELPTVLERPDLGADEPASDDVKSLADEIPDDPDEALAWLEQMAQDDETRDAIVQLAVAEEEEAQVVEEDAETDAEVSADTGPTMADELEGVEMPADEDQALSWLYELGAAPGEPSSPEVVPEMPTPPAAHDVDKTMAEARAIAAAESETPAIAQEEPAVDEEEVSPVEADVLAQTELPGSETTAASETSAAQEDVPAIEADESLDWLDSIEQESPEVADIATESDLEAELLEVDDLASLVEASDAEELGDRPAADIADEVTTEPADEAEGELDWLDSLDEVDVESWLDAEEQAQHEPIQTAESAPLVDDEVATGPLAPDLAEQLEQALSEARHALRSGDTDQAAETYAELIANGDGLAFIIADLEELLEEGAAGPNLYRLLGDAYAQNGQLQKALESYRQALDSM